MVASCRLLRRVQVSGLRLAFQVGVMGGIERSMTGIQPGAMDPDVARNACSGQQQCSQ
jgi:hypothetical protein